MRKGKSQNKYIAQKNKKEKKLLLENRNFAIIFVSYNLPYIKIYMLRLTIHITKDFLCIWMLHIYEVHGKFMYMLHVCIHWRKHEPSTPKPA